MRILSSLRLWLSQLLAGRRSRPEDIPRKMTAQALEAALREARFLAARQVDVKSLSPGELPGLPKRADDPVD